MSEATFKATMDKSDVDKKVQDLKKSFVDYRKAAEEAGRAVDASGKLTTAGIKKSIKEQKDALSDLEQKLKDLEKSKVGKSATQIGAKGGINEQIGLTKRDITEQKKLIDEMGKLTPDADPFGKMFSSLSKWVIGLASAAAALKIVKGIIESTSTTSVEFKSRIEGAKAATDYFFKAIASGDMSNLFNGMKKASEAGQAYIKTMNDIANEQNELNIKQSEDEIKIGELREKTYDKDNSNNAERATNLKEIMRLEKEVYDKRSALEEKKLNAALSRASATSGVSETEIKNLLREYSALEPMIKEGERYNLLKKQQAEFATGNKTINIGAVMQELDAMGQGAAKAGAYAKEVGKVSVEERKLISDLWAATNNEQAAYFSKTRRYGTQLAAVQKELIDNWYKEIEEMGQAQTELENRRVDARIESARKLANIEKEGIDKDLKLAKLDYDQTISDLDKKAVENIALQKKASGNLDESGVLHGEEATQDQKDREIALKTYNNHIAQIYLDANLKIRDIIRQSSEGSMDDLQKQLTNIRAKYEKWRTDLKTLGASPDQIKGLEGNMNAEIEKATQDAEDAAIARLTDFESKKLAITAKYEKLIEKVKNDPSAVNKLNSQKNFEIEKQTADYKQFYDDIATMSVASFENVRTTLLNMMLEAKTAGTITADEYEKLIADINKQADKGYQGKGIEALFGGGKTGGIMTALFGEGDFQGKITQVTKMFSSASNASSAVSTNAGAAQGKMGGAASKAATAIAIIDAIVKAIDQTLTAVANTLKDIADLEDSLGNSDKADNIKEWAGALTIVNSGASQGWASLKSGDVMGSVSSLAGIFLKMATYRNMMHDQKFEKDIEAQALAIRKLSAAYDALERSTAKTLGSDYYNKQKEEIRNLQTQSALISKQIVDEKSKKKPDENKILDLRKQQADLINQIEDIVNQTREDLLGSSLKDAAKSLGDALFDAFSNGTDAAEAWGSKVDDIVQGIVRKLIIQNVIEKPVGDLINSYIGSWVDSQGNFLGMDQIMKSIPALRAGLKDWGESFQALLDGLPPDIKDLFTGTIESPQSLSGTIQKSLTEETGTELAGLMRRLADDVRLNVDNAKMSVNHLIGIEANTAATVEQLLAAVAYLGAIAVNTKPVYTKDL